jgi:Tol biopolymer transport system component/predicted Ser/Thr protein kinase
MALAPGAQLGGYEIRRQLGAGGMGVVYLAHDVKLGRQVAIKVLSGELIPDHSRVRRFEQEARAASALSHTNVCVVHALGETPEGQPFIAMEYIEGQTLRHVLEKQRPSLEAALDIAIQIAAGVGAAHAIGIVHRDLKPENVLIRQDGVVKVLDFGLAKLGAGGLALSGEVSEATRTLVKTDSGVVMGTFTYMAPEQARGQDVDARADIWALGVILYELASGRAPFTGDTRSDVLVSILQSEARPLDQLDARIPHELQRIVAKALRKDRAQRYQTIADLRLDLEALRADISSVSTQGAASQGAPYSTTPAATPPPVHRESSAEYILAGLSRHKVVAAATVAVVAALITAAFVWIRRVVPPSSDVPRSARVERGLTRLTFDKGLQTGATFSPDGRFVAYASDRAGNLDIWVQPVTGGDPVQVTKSPAADTQPDWSPDGSTIVFRSEREGGGLYLVPALGGQERQISSFGVHPKWSADGTGVTFLAGPNLEEGEGPARFFSVSLDGKGPQELAAPFLSNGTWRWIANHPDGRISAAGTHPKLGYGFFTFTKGGDRVVKSAMPPGPALVDWVAPNRVRFQWNAAGSAIYLETMVNGVQNLWRVDVDPTSLAWRSPERLTTGAGSDVEASMSRDGSRLAYTQRTVTTQLWAFPFDALAGRLTGEGKPFTETGAATEFSSLSPDGEAVAYVFTPTGSAHEQLWIAHLDSGHSNMLTDGAVNPVWSPDGRQLVYSRRRDDAGALFVRQLDSASERMVSSFNAGEILLPSGWTPDAHGIIVSMANLGPTPMWLWRAAGADKPERVLLDRPGFNFWEGTLSRDARWLAFVEAEFAHPERGRIFVAPADGGAPDRWVPIAPESPWVDKPRWSPDGRMLYFISKGENGFFDLACVRFDAEHGTLLGSPRVLTHFDSPALSLSPFLDRAEIGISPHRAVLTMLTMTGSIWMLDNVDK